jgi:3-deoxy-D-manno-octulosonic-acid transferase
MSVLFYRFFLLLYSFILRIAALFKPKAKLFWTGRKGLLTQVQAILAQEYKPRIWMHCSSLGEFEQGRPVLERIRSIYPKHAIVLTFFSPSGYLVRKDYKGVDYVFYLPLDSASNAQQFITSLNPSLVLFVKYDLWYFYLKELHQRNIPTLLISAIFRSQQGYFRWYGGVQRKMLGFLTYIFVQDEASVELLKNIEVTNVAVAGDTRFDRVLEAASSGKVLEKMQLLAAANKLLVAGSTWKSDEQMLAKIINRLPNDWKLVIAPHEVHEAHISELEVLFLGQTKRWSEWKDDQSFEEKILIIDSIGLLLKIYSYGTIAWIGGGLDQSGVHNVLEAAVYGLPCAYGPVFDKYIEAKELILSGGARSCNNAEEFSLLLDQWMNDSNAYKEASDAAKKYVHSKGGATQIILDYLVAKNWLSTF